MGFLYITGLCYLLAIIAALLGILFNLDFNVYSKYICGIPFVIGTIFFVVALISYTIHAVRNNILRWFW